MGSSILFACSCRLITPRCISCWFGRIRKWRRLSPGRSVHRAKCRHDGRKKGKKKTA